MTVCGRSTPSRCSCKRTLGRLFNNSVSSFIGIRILRARSKSSHRLYARIIHSVTVGRIATVMYNPTPISIRGEQHCMEQIVQDHSAEQPITVCVARFSLPWKLWRSRFPQWLPPLRRPLPFPWSALLPATVPGLRMCSQLRQSCSSRSASRRYARLSASPGSLYTYASMTLPPWLGATVAWSLLVSLRGHGIERDWRLLSLRKPAPARCHRSRLLGGIARDAGHRRFYLDCLSRCKNLRAPDAVDRSCFP